MSAAAGRREPSVVTLMTLINEIARDRRVRSPGYGLWACRPRSRWETRTLGPTMKVARVRRAHGPCPLTSHPLARGSASRRRAQAAAGRRSRPCNALDAARMSRLGEGHEARAFCRLDAEVGAGRARPPRQLAPAECRSRRWGGRHARLTSSMKSNQQPARRRAEGDSLVNSCAGRAGCRSAHLPRSTR
jgi:hypothetical protein